MKAYLLRLAASVTRPAPALHPLVGSLFPGSLFPGSGQSEQAVAEPHLDPFAAPAHEQDFPAAATVAAPSSYSVRRDEGVTHRPQEREAYSPLIDREIFDPVFAHGAPDVRTQPGAPPDTLADTTAERFPTPAPASSQEGGSRTGRPDARVPEPPRIAPLVAEDVRQPVRPSGPEPLPPPIMAEPTRRVMAQTARLPARDSQSARRRPSVPEPGDIQIHIGRIEVMAAPPAAPRPVAAPVRHAMSLDEYLKRRNGGSR